MSQRNSRRRRPRRRSTSFWSLLEFKDYSGPLLLLFGFRSKKAKLINQYEPYTRRLYALLFVLAALGVIIQYSASCYMCGNSARFGYDPMSICKKQMLYLGICIFLIIVISHFNYQFLKSGFAPVIYTASLLSILILLFSGSTLNGATRSVNIGPISFAPSELMKVTVPIMMAWVIMNYSNQLNRKVMTAWLWAVGVIPAIMLLFISNDLSSAMVVLLMTFCITLVTCRTWKMHLIILIIIAIGALIWVLNIYSHLPSAEELASLPFRRKRIVAWLVPEQYSNTIGYQVLHTLYAVGSGGFIGNGIGTFQKLKDLVPEAYTDVIFSVIVYELGLLGAAVVIMLYSFIIWNMIQVCINAEDLFGSILVLGYSAHIGIQVLLHMAVVLNLMPNTGQTLPLISYGGSMFMCLGMEFGLVMSVYRVHCLRKADLELSGDPVI